MILKLYKAINPSQRHYIGIKLKTTSKTPQLKTKLKKKISSFGGHKKRYRLIINHPKEEYNGIIYSIEYDPNRNANIASVYNPNKNSFFYTLAPNNLNVGDIVKSNKEAQLKVGHLTTLKNISIGCPIYNVSNIISKSAGTYSIIVSKYEKKVKLLLSSGKYTMLPINSYCLIGSVSNKEFLFKQLGKAGRSRWLGNKPQVKGICMNPVDHPNGGGEGKKSSKRKNPWGKVLRSKK
jgi:large subunit ribosomal protein L2